MNTLLQRIKALIPRRIFTFFQPSYHYLMALLGHLIYRMPSKHIKIIGITGTKGKSSTTELVDAVLKAQGYKTAVAGTIRFSIGDDHESNLFKQTMPGRMYLQRFLRRAIQADCDWVIIEMTSEGAKQFRNRYLYLDALIVTNLRPEHLESHGGFENYKRAKLDIVLHSLAHSPKRPRAIIANADDPHYADFIEQAGAEEQYLFSTKAHSEAQIDKDGIDFVYQGEHIHSPLLGEHNFANILATCSAGSFAGVSPQAIKAGIESMHLIPGRGQEIIMGQPFRVIVDYAHTNDSLEAIYQAWAGTSIVGILGACGGGRDRWKRPDFGRIAQEHCRFVVLTNEDPYDEDPMQIIEDMEKGMDKSREGIDYIKILDRREAFLEAFQSARSGEVILITGKGTDPFIMGPRGSRERWSDVEVARETLAQLGYSHNTPTPQR
ncbi:MAG: Mur ligase family protein [Patescibacteria group bacterium]